MTLEVFAKIFAEEEVPLQKFKATGDYVLQFWDNTNGLPQNAVYAMGKDKTGFFWIATEEGLARLDGTTIKVFDKGSYPIMLDQTYYTFFHGKSGIWASSDRSIALLEKTILKVIDCEHIVEDSWIKAISEDANGYLWIGTQDGKVHLWKNDQFNQLPNWKMEVGTETQSLFHMGNGVMLIGTNRGLFAYNYQNNTYSLLTERNVNASKVLVESGRIYIAIPDKGLFRLEEDKKLIELISFEKVKDINFNSLTKDANNNVWAGSTENGIIKINAVGTERYYFDEIKNYTVRKIIYDGENLYLGTHGRGLVIVKPARVRQANHPEILETNVKAVFQDANSNKWVGTKSNGIFRIKDGEISNINTSDGLLLNWINTIGEDTENIYTGTTAGVSVISKNTSKVIGRITEEEGLKSNYVYAVYEDSKERLWILTRYGGLHYRPKNGKLKLIQLPDQFRNTNFNTIKELSNGDILVGSMNYGAFRIVDGVFQENIVLPLKPGENVIYSIHEDLGGDLWFGTHGGIVLYSQGKFNRITKEHGLNSTSVFSITHDGKSGIWISNNFGVQYIPDSELERFKTTGKDNFQATTVTYNKSHGMPNSETNGLIFPSAFKDDEGKIWIPTVEGVGIIDPLNVDWKENSANFQWDEILFADKKMALKETEIIIPAGNSNFQLSFANIDFYNPAEFALSYKIEQLNQEWIPIKDQRTLSFNGLKPGNHTLLVRVLRNGKMDGIHRLDISIKSFFFETLWFKILVISLFIVLVYFVIQYTAKVKIASSLEQLVNQRTLELSTTNHRLKEALEEIESQNITLKDITWQQSHLVRAPLTKALGLIHLLINYPKYKEVGKSKEELEREILKALEELDGIVRNTHSKSEKFVKDK